MKNHDRMDKYWEANLLNFTSSWEATIKIAQDWKQKNVPPPEDPIIDLDALDELYQPLHMPVRDSREERKENYEEERKREVIEEVERYEDIEEDEDEGKNNFDQYEYFFRKL